MGHVEEVPGTQFVRCRLSQGRRETESLHLVSAVSCVCGIAPDFSQLYRTSELRNGIFKMLK